MKYNAVIYDMDGLLIDSMQHWMVKDEVWFGARNIELTQDLIKFFSGRSIRENLTHLKQQYGFPETVDELVAERTSWEHEIYSVLTQEMPGATALFKKVKRSGIRQAIASGAPTTAVERTVARFGWSSYIEACVSSDHVKFVGKPDPAIFLYTAEKLGVEPENCVVFEDAENGVVAAKRAGMKCIAVPDPRWSFGDFLEADLVVDSLEDERVYKFFGV
ncbi:MAG: HAD family phosphatase [Candidatus Magasanikbacteria bacterium]|nr:HAD family phosphatase [Candidatus Magasanikbacteria bacterium]